MPKQSLSVLNPEENRRRRQEISAKYFSQDVSGKRPASVTINKPLSEVYASLREIQNFPQFFQHLEKVEAGGAGEAHWKFRHTDDSDTELSIPMRLTTENSGEGLIWTAKDGAGFEYKVSLQLESAAADRGTMVRMQVSYETTTGQIAGAVEKLFGTDAELTSKINLQRFKAFCETGHFPTIQGQPSGRDEDLAETQH